MTDASPNEAAESGELIVVKLTRSDADEARRLLSLLSGDRPAGTGRLAAELWPRHGADIPLLQRRARDILANRRRRHDIFGRAMFGEPAWEMLLLLYAMDSEARQTISRLADLAGASKSTALRWIDYLDAQRLIRREPHPTDRRAAFVELTEKGSRAVELYLSDTLAPND